MRIFRVDNPHTKAFPFWEWLDRRDQARISRRALPGRGFYASARNAAPGEARLLAVLHLFHLAQHEAGAHGLFHRADADPGARVHAPEPVAQYARHSATNRCRSAGAPPFSRASCWPRRWARTTASTAPLMSWVRTSPCVPAAKNISIPRSTRFATGISTPRTASIRHHRRPSTAPAAKIPLSAPPTTCSSIPPTIHTSSPTANRAVDGGNIVLTVVNLDPFHTQIDLDLPRPRPPPPASRRKLPGPRPPHRRDVIFGRGPAITSSCRPPKSPRTFSASSAKFVPKGISTTTYERANDDAGSPRPSSAKRAASPIRSGSRTRSFTRSTSRPSATATTTASATFPA